MTTYPWIRNLSEILPEMSEIPLFGNAPPYDWERLSTQLGLRLETKGLMIRPGEQEWRKEGALHTGLGSDPFVASVLLRPLDAPLYFAMSRADLNKFLSWMVQGVSKGFTSAPLKEGFSRFLLLEVLDVASKMSPLQKFTPELRDTGGLPDEPAFSVEIECTYGESTCWGRLLLTSSFRKKWVEHFASASAGYTTTPTTQATELIVGLKTGSIVLSQEEWSAVQLGDFLPLQPGGYDARKQTGIATLTIGSLPLFQVKIKQNKLELLDFVMTQEENMEENNRAEEALQPAEEASSSIKEIPFTVCVELARLKISLDRLMQLSPGNMLELPVHPDQGVALTVNGKKIGRAELLHVGETLGIRILELGV